MSRAGPEWSSFLKHIAKIVRIWDIPPPGGGGDATAGTYSTGDLFKALSPLEAGLCEMHNIYDEEQGFWLKCVQLRCHLVSVRIVSNSSIICYSICSLSISSIW